MDRRSMKKEKEEKDVKIKRKNIREDRKGNKGE